METNCVSLETAKKLKAAGFPGRGIAMWWNIGVSGTTLKRTSSPDYGTTEQYPAPTATEIFIAGDRDTSLNHAMPEDAARAWLEIYGGKE